MSRVFLVEAGSALSPTAPAAKAVIVEVGARAGGDVLSVSIDGPDMVEAFGDVELAVVVTGGTAQSYLWQVVSGPSVEAKRADHLLQYSAPGARQRIAQTWRVTVEGQWTAEKTVTTYEADKFELTEDGWTAYGVWELVDSEA